MSNLEFILQNASQSDVAKGGSVFIHRLKSDLWAEVSLCMCFLTGCGVLRQLQR